MGGLLVMCFRLTKYIHNSGPRGDEMVRDIECAMVTWVGSSQQRYPALHNLPKERRD